MIRAITRMNREPGEVPRALCDGKFHYGIFHNTETDNIQCTGCGRIWVPWTGPPTYPTPPTDPAWTSTWLDKPLPTKP